MQAFSSKSKHGFYFSSEAVQGDRSINVISGVMSVLCGLRWGCAGWMWDPSAGVRIWRVGSLSDTAMYQVREDRGKDATFK